MHKELQVLLEKLDEKFKEAENFYNNGDVDEGNKSTRQYLALQDEYINKKALSEAKLQNVSLNGKVIHDGNDKDPGNDEAKTFFNRIRNTNITNAMQVGVNEDGGYTVPDDIQTKINEFRESQDVLTKLVTVESVSAPTGSRTFKKRSQQTGFVEVGELDDIPEKSTPQFTRLKYEIKKYAGFLPTSNELLTDSDAALERVIVSWLANESRVTRNKLILNILDTKEKTLIATVDDIKREMNITLDPAFHTTTLFITNQDGFNWLDTLKDVGGRYLLQESLSAASGKQLFGKDVIVVSNKDLPTTDNLAPFIIGDLKEAITLFDRKQLSVVSSKEAGNAFTTDSTIFRAIERLDIQIRDEEAFIYAQIDLSDIEDA